MCIDLSLDLYESVVDPSSVVVVSIMLVVDLEVGVDISQVGPVEEVISKAVVSGSLTVVVFVYCG